MNAHSEYLNVPHERERLPVLETEDARHATSHSKPPLNQPHARPPRLGRLIFFVAIGLVVAFIVGIVPRIREHQQVTADTHELAVPTVAIVNPVPGKFIEPLVLSGELRPLIEASAGLKNVRLIDAHSFCWIFSTLLKLESEGLIAKATGKHSDGEDRWRLGTLRHRDPHFHL